MTPLGLFAGLVTHKLLQLPNKFPHHNLHRYSATLAVSSSSQPLVANTRDYCSPGASRRRKESAWVLWICITVLVDDVVHHAVDVRAVKVSISFYILYKIVLLCVTH